MIDGRRMKRTLKHGTSAALLGAVLTLLVALLFLLAAYWQGVLPLLGRR